MDPYYKKTPTCYHYSEAPFKENRGRLLPKNKKRNSTKAFIQSGCGSSPAVLAGRKDMDMESQQTSLAIVQGNFVDMFFCCFTPLDLADCGGYGR